MASDFWEKNRRAMVGLLILSVLVVANLAVRWGRRSGGSAPKAVGPEGEMVSGVTAGGGVMSARLDSIVDSPVQGQRQEAGWASSPASGARTGMPAVAGLVDLGERHAAWQEVRQRLASLEHSLAEIPAILPDSMRSSPFAPPSRNLFAWVTPAPPPPAGSEAAPLLPPPLPAHLASPPVILGKVRQGGRTHLMIREGNRVFFVTEGEPASGVAYTLLAHGPDRALLLKPDGAQLEVRPPAPAVEDGLQRALLVLQGKHPERMGFRLRPLASAPEKIQNQKTPTP